jgi:phage-related protein
MECGDRVHEKAWNVAIKYMKRHGMWQSKYMKRHGMWRAFANCNGDYSKKVRLEIKTQQLTLNQDKQNEHNLNPTM